MTSFVHVQSEMQRVPRHEWREDEVSYHTWVSNGSLSLHSLSTPLSLSLLSISFYNTLFFTYSITPLFNGFRRVRITSGKRASFEFSNKTQLRHRYTTWKPHADTCLNERWSKWKRRRMGRIATVIHRRRNHRLTPRHFQKREGGRE